MIKNIAVDRVGLDTGAPATLFRVLIVTDMQEKYFAVNEHHTDQELADGLRFLADAIEEDAYYDK